MKRRSAASSTSPRDKPVFFVDRSLGSRRLVDALREDGHVVVAHDELFAPDAPDEVWLTHAGRNDWVVLTKDQRIRYRDIERTALVRARVRAFVFVQKQQKIDDVIETFRKARTSIERMMAERKPPFLAAIQTGGRVVILLS